MSRRFLLILLHRRHRSTHSWQSNPTTLVSRFGKFLRCLVSVKWSGWCERCIIPPASTSNPACVTILDSSAFAPTLVFIPSMHPSSFALFRFSTKPLLPIIANSSPILDDAMIQNDTARDLHHLAYYTMFADDRLFYTCPFVDLRCMTDHAIRRYLSSWVDQGSALRIAWQCISRLRQELTSTVVSRVRFGSRRDKHGGSNPSMTEVCLLWLHIRLPLCVRQCPPVNLDLMMQWYFRHPSHDGSQARGLANWKVDAELRYTFSIMIFKEEQRYLLFSYFARLLREYCILHSHGMNSSRTESRCGFSCSKSRTDLRQTYTCESCRLPDSLVLG